MISNMPAAARLYLLVIVMSLFITGTGLYGIVEIRKMHGHTQTLYRDRLLPLHELTTIRYLYSVRIISSVEQLQTASASFAGTAVEISAAQKTIAANWTLYLATYLTPEEQQLAAQASVLMNGSAKSIEQMINLLNSKDQGVTDHFIHQQFYPTIYPVVGKITALIDLQVDVAEQVYKKNTAVYYKTIMQSILLIIICLAFAIPFSYYLLRNIKRLIEDLQESERKYRNIFENVQDVFYQTSLEGTVLEVSPSIEYHMGIPRSNILGSSALNFYYDPQDREKAIRIIKEEGTLTDYEFRLKSDSGEPVYASLNARLIPGTEGKPPHIDGLFRNITERKKAAERILQSESNYRQLFDYSPAPMWVLEEETFRFMQVNKSCIDHYGYTEKEFATMTIMDIIHGYPDNTASNNHTQENRVRGLFTGSQQHIKKSGELIDAETSSIPVILNGKKQILVVAIDVTERNRYEQKLNLASIKAQEDERYEIGGELHDNVCQILASSLLFLDITKKELPSAPVKNFEMTHQYISLATREIRNLSHRLAPVFFEGTRLQDTFETFLTSSNMENKYEIALDFDDTAKNYPLNRDLQLNLYRVLQEQWRNISKHAGASSIVVTATITNNILQMKIADDGVGFDTGNIKSGIGLSNMNRRVQLFGGKFRVRSSAGNGCEITVQIPLAGS